jgi:amino acid transporter
MGWSFYNNANAAWADGKGVFGIFPYPAMLAGWVIHNQAAQIALILLMSLWFFGWVGTLFLSSTRVIFAAAFDRVLPDVAATVSEKRKVPMASLVLMLLPAVGLSALYAYWGNFRTYTLDATLVIAVTYLFSAFAAVILPWRKPELWAASPASRFKFLGIPLVPFSGLVTMGLIIFNLYHWFSNSAYGVNSRDSLYFMGIMYLLAICLYTGARIVRKRQGIDLGLINKEIPVE